MHCEVANEDECTSVRIINIRNMMIGSLDRNNFEEKQYLKQ